MKVAHAASLPAIALTILLTVAGQLLIKKGLAQVSGSGLGLVGAALLNPQVLLGLGLAVGAAAAWILALSQAPISFAYPFMTLAIVLVLVLSSAMFGEKVTVKQWCGVGLVCLGLAVAAMRD